MHAFLFFVAMVIWVFWDLIVDIYNDPPEEKKEPPGWLSEHNRKDPPNGR